MFDMGFRDDMKFILQRVPKDRQILLFSATMNFEVVETAYRFGSEPVEFNLSKDQVKAENVEDSIFHVGHTEKPQYLLSLIRKHTPKQLIVFSNFKSNVERIAKFLSKNGVPAMGISSLLTQAQRNRVITQFKEGQHQNIMVATDVAARGLDIKNVDMVINFDLPDDAENYVHRIGRTGRAGASGKAFSFVSDRDVDALGRIEDYLGHKVDVSWLEEGEILKEFDAFPPPTDRFEKPNWGSQKDGAPRGDRGPRRPDGRNDRNRGPRGPRDDRPRRDEKQGPRPLRTGPAPTDASGKPAPLSTSPRGAEGPNRGSRPAGPKRELSRGPQNQTQKQPGRAPTAGNQVNKNAGKNYELKRRPLNKAKPTIVDKVSKFFKGLFS